MVLLLSHCAQIVPLTGGEPDRSPPVLLEAVPANNSTGFTGGEIVLRFDEYVQLKDLNNQLMISPRLRTAPKVLASGKTVVVTFKTGELQPGTTCRIDFAKAIADMNESNSLPNFSYVFSTGEMIDTLKLSGSVTTASNNAAGRETIVGLYRQSDTLTASEQDSLLYLFPPDYSARTSESGQFTISNLPAGIYYIYALNDNNRNNIYDGGAEKVAFLNEHLVLNSDSTVSLRMFLEEPPAIFVKRSFSAIYGAATIILNTRAAVSMKPLNHLLTPYLHETRKNVLKDTVEIFYHNINDSLSLALSYKGSVKRDTVHILLPENRASGKRLRTFKTNTGTGLLRPQEELSMTFPVWMDTTYIRRDRLKMAADEDSAIGGRTAAMRWLDIRTLLINAPLKSGITYKLKPDTGFVRDLDGVSNDTAQIVFTKQDKAELSKLTLNIRVQQKRPYVLQLINGAGSVVAERAFEPALSSSNMVQINFEDLLPGTYRAKVIFDDNANGRWDTGHLIKRLQPEKVLTPAKEFKLLADWEVEETLEVK